MKTTGPHVRLAEILLAVAVLFLWGYRMLPELGDPSPPPALPEYRVELNRAGWQELTNLPGIGESRARGIVRNRGAEGPFSVPEELMRVHGIGPVTVEGIRGHLNLE